SCHSHPVFRESWLSRELFLIRGCTKAPPTPTRSCPPGHILISPEEKPCNRMFNALDVDRWVAERRSSLDEAKESVAAIIQAVRKGGDGALLAMARKHEPDITSVRVTEEEIAAAYDEVEDRLVESLVEAEARITRFHELPKERSIWLEEVEPGIVLGVKTTPLDRVGLYVPG